MQIVHNTEAMFSVSINPYLRRIQIINLEPGDAGAEMVTWRYKELDEWYSTWFTKRGERRLFDFHFEYDDSTNFSICPVIAGNTDTTKSIPHNLYIEF